MVINNNTNNSNCLLIFLTTSFSKFLFSFFFYLFRFCKNLTSHPKLVFMGYRRYTINSNSFGWFSLKIIEYRVCNKDHGNRIFRFSNHNNEIK